MVRTWVKDLECLGVINVGMRERSTVLHLLLCVCREGKEGRKDRDRMWDG